MSPAGLRIERARALAVVLAGAGLDFVSLVECRRIDEADEEIVVFDTDVELGQIVVNDIRPRERLAVRFSSSSRGLPAVYALRMDFPPVPHLLRTPKGDPRSLCLYDGDPYEVGLRWTPVKYIERIRYWLAETARGTLHGDDQPLEPLLQATRDNLIVPSDLLSRLGESGAELLILKAAVSNDSYRTIIVDYAKRHPEKRRNSRYVVLAMHGEAQTHGVVHGEPKNLAELDQFLRSAGMDMVGRLRTLIGGLYREKALADVRASRLIILVALPKARAAGGVWESVDFYAFLTQKTVLEVGERLGVLKLKSGAPCLLSTPDAAKTGSGVEITQANVMPALSREIAAAQNGTKHPSSTKIAQIGVGALGSQVFLNLVRAGYGEWILIDSDCLFPHNMARHALFGDSVGTEKAAAMARFANDMIDGPPIARSVVANVLGDSKEKDAAARKAYQEADVLLDVSTSVAVARYLSRDVDAPGRRVSMYLNPRGTALVILGEDAHRHVRLDYLEMLYYRYLVHDSSFTDHLAPAAGSLRYGRSCRDVATSIPQDFVALFAAIGARALREATTSPTASISIWRADGNDITIVRHRVSVQQMIEAKIGAWTVCTNQGLLDKVSADRIPRLPNETGGILIGSFDTDRRIAYVVDALSSPAGSIEGPTAYIRGSQGLRRCIEAIETTTGGGLTYVGEWHSHPPGEDAALSTKDIETLNGIKRIMARDGYPALVLIVAEAGCEFHIEEWSIN